MHYTVKVEEVAQFFSNYTINVNAQFKNTCLESNLAERLTAPIKMQEDVCKFLIATSGAGKTRRCYEELYSKYGIFFTCSKQGNGGSDDMKGAIEWCITLATNGGNRHHVDQCLKTLIYGRVQLVNYMIDILKFAPSMVLLAQIHPDLVFGEDIFKTFFEHLMTKYDPTKASPLIFGTFMYPVVIDEIQSTLQSPSIFDYSRTPRTVFSPLYKNMTTFFSFKYLIFSGTGTDFNTTKDHLMSTSFKSLPYVLLTDFKPMTEDQVYDFSLNTLKSIDNLNDSVDIETVSKQLSSDPLFVGGRPRFTAFILDSLRNGDSFEGAISQFNLILTLPNHEKFPIRNWTEKQSCIVQNQTYYTLVLDALVSYLCGKDAVINVTKDVAADLINIGIGYCSVREHEYIITLSELATIQAFYALLNPADISSKFMEKMFSSLNNCIAGFHFEYLVMLKFYYDCPQDQPFRIIHGSLSSVLRDLENEDINTREIIAFFPDVFAGKVL